MKRLVLLVALVAACGRAPSRVRFAVALGDAVRVSTDRDNVEHTTIPALAQGPHGLLVTWATARRDDEIGDHIMARELSSAAAILGEPIELGRGYAPDVTTIPDGFVVAWRSPRESGSSFAFAKVGSSSRQETPPVFVRETATVGALSVAATARGIVAAACSDDYDHVTLVRDPFGVPTTERFRPRSGCNDVRVSSSGNSALAAVEAQEFRGTELIELGEPVRSTGFFDGHCDDILADSTAVALACLAEPDANVAYIRREVGEPKRIEVDFGGRVIELRAVALTEGILLAWTIDTAEGVALRAAIVNLDGRGLSDVVEILPKPALPRFSLEGDGSVAWVVYVTERQIDESKYRDDVVVVPLTLKRI